VIQVRVQSPALFVSPPADMKPRGSLSHRVSGLIGPSGTSICRVYQHTLQWSAPLGGLAASARIAHKPTRRIYDEFNCKT
jgi:hypothetical protein